MVVPPSVASDLVIFKCQYSLCRTLGIYFLTTKRKMTKFRLQNFKNVKSKLNDIERANSVDLNEVADYEPPFHNLQCLQI